jgi:hypothetical protein
MTEKSRVESGESRAKPLSAQEIADGAAVMAGALKDIAYLTVPLSPGEMLAVIAHVQLALRHPGNKGPTAQLAETVIRRWIDLLPEAVRPYQMLGFDSAYDVERESLGD